MEIVSGRTGSPHVTSQQFRQLVEGTVGQESYILTSGENLEPELASNNILKIRSGMMSHHGNISSIKIGTYDEVELTNGSQGMKRIDLVVNRYTRNAETNVEANNWVVITGTPVASDPAVPAYTVGNLQEGDLTDDCPVFEVHYDGLNVTEIKKLLDVADNLGKMKTELAELNGKLITGEFVQLATAGATKTQTVYKDIDSLSNYKAIALYCNYASGYYCNPFICSVEMFRAMSWIVSDRRDNNQNYSAMLHLESDARVKFVTVNADALLYGIR